MVDLNKELIDFFQALHASALNEQKLQESTDLYRDGFLDSLSTLHLIQTLEKKFNFRFGPFLITRKNFSTLSRIQSLVEEKVNKR